MRAARIDHLGDLDEQLSERKRLLGTPRAEMRLGKRRDVVLALVERALRSDPAHAEARALKDKLKP
jgi:hypothetical protein